MRQARLLVEVDDGGLGVGAHLAGRGLPGIGRLQRVPALHAAAALLALADVDVELPADGLAWKLGLVLRRHAGLDQAASAGRAGVG